MLGSNVTAPSAAIKGFIHLNYFQERLSGTFSSDKNEILFSEFGINYNNEPEQFKKGTTLFRKKVPAAEAKAKLRIVEANCDIIGEDFWTQNTQIIANQCSN
jgi:tRNA(His) guanylyltransferase